LVSAERLETAVLEALRKAARQPERSKLRELLGDDREGWEEWDVAEREGVLRRVIQGIVYEGRRGKWRVRLEFSGQTDWPV
jgi:hypothetical protein